MQKYDRSDLKIGFPADRTYLLDREIKAEGVVNQSGIEGLLIAGSCPAEFRLDSEEYKAFLVEQSPLRVWVYVREDIQAQIREAIGSDCITGLIARLEGMGYNIKIDDKKLEKFVV
jgi:hypothetical protein